VRVRVIGVGQRYRGDDAVGLLVAERIRAIVPAGVEVAIESSDAAALLAAFEGTDACVAVDSARNCGAPGAVLRLHPGEVVATRGAATSSHGNALAEAVALGAALGCLPRCFRIVAVVGSNFRVGDALSAPVQAALPDAIAAVLEEVTALSMGADAHA
jgi:hydrogenase maturation protease